MIPKIKICGIKTHEETAFLNNMAVDYVGFVFAESKRRVEAEHAAGLCRSLRQDILKVGVFADMPLEEVGKIMKICSLDIAQLHGSYTDKEITKLLFSVWMGIPVKSKESVDAFTHYPSAKAFVLDTYMPDLRGGTGKTFNWELAAGLSKANTIVLAGGLDETNVGKAICCVKPHVVDVSSGVEGLSGKDEKKVRNFIKAVKANEYQ